MRQLEPFPQAEVVDIVPRRVRERRRELRKLVESPTYKLLGEVAQETLGPLVSPLPQSGEGRVAYETWSIAQDVVNAVFAAIETQAALAVNEEEEADAN